jgi:hypothetical protein
LEVTTLKTYVRATEGAPSTMTTTRRSIVTRRSVRVGIVAVMAAAMGSGALLAFPAHADTFTCTSNTGTAVCVLTQSERGFSEVAVVEGTAPNLDDGTAVAVFCNADSASTSAISLAAEQSGPPVRIVPVASGLPVNCPTLP